MTDTLSNKPKLQLRSSPSFSDKASSPGTKLLLNHGKPNFTIQRTPKGQQNGDANNNNPLSPKPQSIGNGNDTVDSGTIKIINNNNNNEITFKNANGVANGAVEVTVKSKQLNGSAIVKPSSLPIATEGTQENEAAKVVLRRVLRPAQRDLLAAGEVDDGVPEFIRRQRRIQERLAKEGLDFENRRSGYFTQVMLSPTAPQQRTSFMETMSSPAIVPSLEMPPPVPSSPPPQAKLLEVEEEEPQTVTPALSNGHDAAAAAAEDEEEVAKAIAEVNKAVEGEDDDVSAAATLEADEPQLLGTTVAVTTSLLLDIDDVAVEEVQAAAADVVGEAVQAAVAHVEEETLQNGHTDADVTISHTNGTATPTAEQEPSLPTPDPSGALGVNYEPKTVVSFSKDLGEPNKYPDTVKLDGNGEAGEAPIDPELAELVKLKFDIKADEEDVQVTPVLRAE